MSGRHLLVTKRGPDVLIHPSRGRSTMARVRARASAGPAASSNDGACPAGNASLTGGCTCTLAIDTVNIPIGPLS
jgi:hypothetical protein